MRVRQFCTALAIPTASILLILIPVLFSYYNLGKRALFNFLAVQLDVLPSSSKQFSQVWVPHVGWSTPTNGFQPLWELLLIAIFKLFHVDHGQQLFVLFGLSVIFVSASYALISLGFVCLLEPYPALIATLTLFPGFYSVIFRTTGKI